MFSMLLLTIPRLVSSALPHPAQLHMFYLQSNNYLPLLLSLLMQGYFSFLLNGFSTWFSVTVSYTTFDVILDDVNIPTVCTSISLEYMTLALLFSNHLVFYPT